MIIDYTLDTRIFLSGLAFAAGIEAYRRSTGGGRRHYMVASVLIAFSAFTPLTGFASSRALVLPFVGVLGGIYVIGRVLDHFELATILGPASETPQGASGGSAV